MFWNMCSTLLGEGTSSCEGGGHVGGVQLCLGFDYFEGTGEDRKRNVVGVILACLGIVGYCNGLVFLMNWSEMLGSYTDIAILSWVKGSMVL